jgi:hypothetical protein
MHSVGLDEAHEMCINKESKTSISRPTKDNLQRLVHFFPYRSNAMKNLKDQLMIKSTNTVKVHVSKLYTTNTYVHECVCI